MEIFQATAATAVVAGGPATAAVSIMLLLSASEFAFNLPQPIDIVQPMADANVSNVRCHLSIPEIKMMYNSDAFQLEMKDSNFSMVCTNDLSLSIFGGAPSKHKLLSKIEIPRDGMMYVDRKGTSTHTKVNDTKAPLYMIEPTSTASPHLEECTLTPTIDVQTVPTTDSFNGILQGMLPSIIPSVHGLVESLCENVTDALTVVEKDDSGSSYHEQHPDEKSLLNPPKTFSPFRFPDTHIQDWHLAKALVNIVRNGLPPSKLEGMILDASIVSPTALRISGKTPAGGFTIPQTLLDMLSSSPGVSHVYLPEGLMFSLDLVVKDLSCKDNGLACYVPRNGGLQLLNLRLASAPDARMNVALPFQRLVTNVFGPMLTELINILLPIVLFPNAGPVIDGQETLDLSMHEATVTEKPPYWLLALLCTLLGGCGVGVIAYSASRHTHNPVVDLNGKAIPTFRVIMEDSIVVALAFGCIFLFAWSNTTHAVKVVIGDEIVLYSFSLHNTVSDLWQAGLKPLAIFVVLFSGIYPYVKMMAIVLYSVILQRPQSKVLRAIDLLGKFSFLDTFVMIIMLEGLKVPGIAKVEVLASFWIFMFATILSIITGNYATHGWRRETHDSHHGSRLYASSSPDSLTSPNNNTFSAAPIQNPFVQYNASTNDDYDQYGSAGRRRGGGSSTDDDEDDVATTLVPIYLRSFLQPFGQRWPNIPACVFGGLSMIVAGVCVSIFDSCLTYKLTGVATLITGTTRSYSLLKVFEMAGDVFIPVGAFTIIIAPALYFFGLPKIRILAAWCSTDAFLVACLASLLQLGEFIKIVVGKKFEAFYGASATLGWPLYVLGATCFIQWIFIFYHSFFHDHQKDGLIRKSHDHDDKTIGIGGGGDEDESRRLYEVVPSVEDGSSGFKGSQRHSRQSARKSPRSPHS